jgi:hypothetical protein
MTSAETRTEEKEATAVRLTMAVVEPLEGIGGGRWQGVGRGGVQRRTGWAHTEAVAEEKLLIFAIEVEDLEELGPGFFDDLGAGGIGTWGDAGGIGGAGGVSGFESGKAFVEAREECALFLEKKCVGDALILF